MKQNIPNSVVLCECWARDGLQNIPDFIDTEHKLSMINKFIEAGFKRIEVTSFSHPKYVPQFKDAEEVVKRLPQDRDDITFKATCVNEVALERAIKCKQENYNLNEVSFVMAASEAYNKINVRLSNKELLNQINNMIDKAFDNGLDVLVSVSTAYGCPVKGEVSQEEVIDLVKQFGNLGVKKITIGDTTGEADPYKSYSLFSKLLDQFDDITFVAHFHDTKGWGIANALYALEAGVDHFDVSLGGIGGPPSTREGSQSGNTGNVCTEDFVSLLKTLNVNSGLSLKEVMNAGLYSEELLGRQRSQTLRSYQL